jgi:hypothetical protein
MAPQCRKAQMKPYDQNAKELKPLERMNQDIDINAVNLDTKGKKPIGVLKMILR